MQTQEELEKVFGFNGDSSPVLFQALKKLELENAFPPGRLSFQFKGTKQDISNYLAFSSFCSQYEGLEDFQCHPFKVPEAHKTVSAEISLFENAVALMKELASLKLMVTLRIEFGCSKDYCRVIIATDYNEACC